MIDHARAVISITSLCLALSSQAGTAAYDAAGEFGITNGNPNGAWSYGWMSTDLTGFTLYTNGSTDGALGGGGANPQWWGWHTDRTPLIWLNRSGIPIPGVLTGQLCLHPGPASEPCVLRWTAPASNKYAIVGQFFPGDTGIPQVGVRVGTNWLWQASDAGVFAFTRSVASGEAIDFIAYGAYDYCTTPLDLMIAPIVSGASFRDDYSGTYSSCWAIARRDTNYWGAMDSSLVVRASSGTLTTSANSAKNVFMVSAPASEAFVVTLRCNSFQPTNDSAQVNVLAYDSDDSSVCSIYGHIGGERKVELGTEKAAYWSSSAVPLDFGDGPFCLRLVKVGTTYRQFWSTNGIQYHSVNNPVEYGDGTPAFVGFAVFGDPTEATTAWIDWFEMTEISPQPRLDRIQVGGDGVVVDLADLINGTSNTLQRCGDLSSPGWTDVVTFTAFDTHTNVTDSGANGLDKAFYRAIVH